jgi:hypothetical protein
LAQKSADLPAVEEFFGPVLIIKQGLFSWSDQEYARRIEVLNTGDVRDSHIRYLSEQEGLLLVQAVAQADIEIRQWLVAQVHSASAHTNDARVATALQQFNMSTNIQHTCDCTTLHFQCVESAVEFYKFFRGNVEPLPRSVASSKHLNTSSNYFTMQPAKMPHILRPVPALKTCVLATMDRFANNNGDASLVNTQDQQEAAMIRMRQVCTLNGMQGEPFRLDLLHSLPNRKVKVCIVFRNEASVATAMTGQVSYAFKTHAWVAHLVKPAGNPLALHRPPAKEVSITPDERLKELYMADKVAVQTLNQSASPIPGKGMQTQVTEPSNGVPPSAPVSTVAVHVAQQVQPLLSSVNASPAIFTNLSGAGVEAARGVISSETKDAGLELTSVMDQWVDMCVSVLACSPEGAGNLTQLLAGDINAFQNVQAPHMTLVQICHIYQSAITKAVFEDNEIIDTSEADPSLVLWEAVVHEARNLLTEKEQNMLSSASLRRRTAMSDGNHDLVADRVINMVVPKISAALQSKLMISKQSANILAMEVAWSFHSTVTQPQDGGAAKK